MRDETGERYGEIKYRGGRVLQRRRGWGGNVSLSYLLTRFLLGLQLGLADLPLLLISS